MTEDEFTDKMLLETISQSDEFYYLNNLTEEQKIEVMKTWGQSTWIRYCSQNTLSEEEVFDPILRLIEENDEV